PPRRRGGRGDERRGDQPLGRLLTAAPRLRGVCMIAPRTWGLTMRTTSRYALVGYRLRWAYAGLWFAGAYLYWDYFLAESIEWFLGHPIVTDVFDTARLPLDFVIWFWAGDVLRSSHLVGLFNMLNEPTSQFLTAIATPCVLTLGAWLFMRSSRENRTHKV